MPIEEVEGWHAAAVDGKKLYTKTWKAEGEERARVVFVHGFSEHCNTHGILFPTLAQHGISVYSFDQRGWGRSVSKPSERGLTGPTRLVLDDISSFLRTLVPSPVPLFLMGHSMGGGEVLCYLALGPTELLSQIRGFMVIAPFVSIHPDSRPGKLTVVLGRLASKVFPTHQMVNKIDPALLCRDPAVQREIERDPLCHDTGTLEGLAGMLDRAKALGTGAVRIPGDAGEGGVTRLWISHGTEDRVCDFAGTKRFVERIEGVRDLTFKVYEGWYHRLHQEPGEDKVRYINDILAWIEEKLKDPTASRSKL